MPLRNRLAAGLAVAGLLTGCAGLTPYERLAAVHPTGSAFSQALYRNYAQMAKDLNIAALPGRTAFDARASLSLTPVPPDQAQLAIYYAKKAEEAARGDEPLPEAAPADDTLAENLRLDLLRMLGAGRTKAPLEAARAQTDYDCWILDAPLDGLVQKSKACHAALLADLVRLKKIPGILDGAPPAPPAPAASTPAPSPIQD